MDELLTLIAKHLESYAYKSVLEDGVLKISHATRAHFWVLPAGEFVVFRTMFQVGPEAQVDPTGFLRFLNQANGLCVVARYIDRQGLLSIEASFPNHYYETIFAAFFNQYLSDIEAPVKNDRDTVARFFPA